jgi:hypothetical protein
MLASGRGLLSGGIIAMTFPLLVNAHAIAASSSAGLGDVSRIGLTTVEMLGAALFAFEIPVVAGYALLLVSFGVAALIHAHHHETPWWLALYAIVGAVLLYLTRRAMRERAIT